MAKFTATVHHLEFEDHLSESAVNDYLHSAILTECGFAAPEHPASTLVRESVQVKAVRVRENV
jgi:hypothetical protein